MRALILLLAVSLPAMAALTPPTKAKKSPAPAKKAARKPLSRPVMLEETPPAIEAKASPEPAPAAAEAPAERGSPRDALADAGLSLLPSPSPSVACVLPDSPASALGVLAGDALVSVGGGRTASSSDVAWTLRSWPAGARLSAVALRGRSVIALGAPPAEPELPGPRSAERLSPHEDALAKAHLRQAGERVPEILRALRTPSFTVPAGEKIWVRFPQGLSKLAEQGEILEAETATGLTTDANLDFLAVPHGSRVWLQVLSARDSGPARVLRMHAFKIQLAGGRIYPCSAMLEAVSGRQDLLRVAPGGAVVGAAEETEKLLADADRNFQLRFLEPWTITEAESFFPAGPGLWIKSAGSPEDRVFEVTHVIAERSAQAAGLKVGDAVTAVDGRSSAKLSFSEATRLLYGPAQTTADLSVRDGNGTRRVRLARGVLQRKGLGLSWRWEGEGASVTRVFSGSPADRAGIEEGALLLRVGGRAVSALGEAGLRAAFKGDLAEADALTFQNPGGRVKTADLRRGWVAYPLRQALEGIDGI